MHLLTQCTFNIIKHKSWIAKSRETTVHSGTKIVHRTLYVHMVTYGAPCDTDQWWRVWICLSLDEVVDDVSPHIVDHIWQTVKC